MDVCFFQNISLMLFCTVAGPWNSEFFSLFSHHLTSCCILFFQQWMVNGEICIGLFALRNIKQVCFLPPIITFMCISLLITLYLVASYFGIFCCYVLNNFESLYQLCQFIFLYVCLLCILIIDRAGKCEIVYFQTRSLKTIEFSTSLLPLK
jgi:hypothetical protein